MNSVILCEGSTDYTLLQYYMRKANGWLDKKEIQRDVFKMSGQRSRIFFREDSFLTIAATGGCSQMNNGLERALKKNYLASPSNPEQRFDCIVMITDRDEITTEEEFVEKIKEEFQKNKVLYSEVTNNQWLKCKMKNSVGSNVEFRFLLLVIPFEEKGAMETFLLKAIAAEDEYDKKIIECCNDFVDNIDIKKRYLSNRRYITKAKFDTYFSIRKQPLRSESAEGIPS